MSDESDIRDQVLDEAIAKITETARGHLAAKKGHMLWAEANNVLRSMKSKPGKEAPDVPHHPEDDPRSSDQPDPQADGVLRTDSD